MITKKKELLLHRLIEHQRHRRMGPIEKVLSIDSIEEILDKGYYMDEEREQLNTIREDYIRVQRKKIQKARNIVDSIIKYKRKLNV